MSEEKKEFNSGVTSTKQTRLSLIPHNGLLNAAVRFELGIERHGEKSWNNLSTNKNALVDVDWLIERLSHAIEHCYNAIEILRDTRDPHRCKDDAGAIAWCGLVIGEAAFFKSAETLENQSHKGLYPHTPTCNSILIPGANCNCAGAKTIETQSAFKKNIFDRSSHGPSCAYFSAVGLCTCGTITYRS